MQKLGEAVKAAQATVVAGGNKDAMQQQFTALLNQCSAKAPAGQATPGAKKRKSEVATPAAAKPAAEAKSAVKSTKKAKLKKAEA